jgi:RNase adaptor protein for sRNA GlmZ degradation
MRKTRPTRSTQPTKTTSTGISLDFNPALLTPHERAEMTTIRPQDLEEWKADKGIEQAVRRNAEYFDNLIISTYGIDNGSQPLGSRAFDCRRLNLLGNGLDLKSGRGCDPEFQACARTDPEFQKFIIMVAKCILENGLTNIAFYCSKGHHRSVAAATLFRDRFAKNAKIYHTCLRK